MNIENTLNTAIKTLTQFNILPPNDTFGTLIIDTNNPPNIYLEDKKSIQIDNYYTGWKIITITDGVIQYSFINNYTASDRQIKTSFTTGSNLINGHTKYILIKEDIKNGKLKSSKITYPLDGYKLPLLVGHSITNTISTEFYLKLSEHSTQKLSNEDNFYKDWNITIFYNGEENNYTIFEYNGLSKEILINSSKIKEITDNRLNITYILTSNQKLYLLDQITLPFKNYYKGWTIKINKDNITQSSRIPGFNEITKEITTPSISLKDDCIYNYSLEEHR